MFFDLFGFGQRRKKGGVKITGFVQDAGGVKTSISTIKVSGNRGSNINVEGVQENAVVHGGGHNINIKGTQKNVVVTGKAKKRPKTPLKKR